MPWRKLAFGTVQPIWYLLAFLLAGWLVLSVVVLSVGMSKRLISKAV